MFQLNHRAISLQNTHPILALPSFTNRVLQPHNLAPDLKKPTHFPLPSFMTVCFNISSTHPFSFWSSQGALTSQSHPKITENLPLRLPVLQQQGASTSPRCSATPRASSCAAAATRCCASPRVARHVSRRAARSVRRTEVADKTRPIHK